jgi:SAM-dependent methyltransferase
MGVDWRTAESQDLRFTQLLAACRPDSDASILDFGCGYGSLAARLRRDGYRGAYCGHDVSTEMVAAAASAHGELPDCTFIADASTLRPADYTLASGIFNVRMDIGTADWEAHIRGTLDTMAGLSRRGFAFNMLTRYADAERMRLDLYYADPASWLTYCLDRFSRHAAILHDYPLYEFTLFVRSDARHG